MKNRIILMAAAIAAMVVSCQKEEISTPVVKTEPMVISTVGEVDTKTLLNGNAVVWSEDDVISVFDNANKNNQFTQSKAPNGATAIFAGEVTEGTTDFYAVYPYREGSTAENGILYVNLPSDQTAKVGSFAEEHNISVAKGTRNGGANTEVTGVAFKNVCALLKFTVPSYVENVTSVVVSSESDLAGEMTIDYREDIPSVSVSGQKTVSMERSSNNPFENGSTFWFVVAPTTLDGLTVTVKTANDNTYVMSTGAEIPLTAGKAKNIGVLKLGTTASAAHTYDAARKILTGTAVTVNLIKPTIGTVNLNVYNNNGTKVREYSTEITSEEPKSIVLPSDNDWPYLPKGDYIVSASYTTSDGKTENLYNLNLNINEGPDFTDKGSESFSAAAPITTYSYYLKGDLTNANKYEDALKIKNVNSGSINLPENFINNPNYSIGKTVAVDNDATISEDKTYATATKLGQHTVTTTYTFDGVSVAKDAICYITGLPHTGLPNTTLWEQTNYAAEVDWEGNGTNSYVKLEGFVGSASGIRTKNGFFVPSGGTIDATVNIDVNFLSIEYKLFGTRYYKAKLTCKIGNTTFISTEPGNATQYPFNNSSNISISNGNKMLIQCECWTMGPNISINYVDILYR